MKKDRSDSFETKLQRNQVEALERWLFEENISYEEAQKRLWEDCSLRISRTALSRFYQRTAQRRLEESIVERAAAANRVIAKVEENPADMYRAIIKMVENIAFDKSTTNLDTETLYKLTHILIAAKGKEQKDRELDQSDRKLALLEAREEKTKKVLSDEKLTPEEQNQKLRSVFGMS